MIILPGIGLLAQSATSQQAGRRHVLAVSVLGDSPGIGIKWDQRLQKGTIAGPGLQLGIGVGGAGFGLLGTVSVTTVRDLTVKYNYVSSENLYATCFGAGLSFRHKEELFGFIEFDTRKSQEANVVFSLSRRRQPINGGLHVEYGIDLVLGKGGIKSFPLGLSIGYAF